ncbi:MAG: hypothetical protein ACRDJC_11555 [Thermomicrobiales bacterium]
MAPRHKEIVRELGDGFAVAWDTTEVSDDVRTTFQEAVDSQVDIAMKALTEEGAIVILGQAKAFSDDPAAPPEGERRVAEDGAARR